MPAIASPVPLLDSSLTTQTGARGQHPLVRCSLLGQLSWGRGRLLPSVRCMLVNNSDAYAATGTTSLRLGSASSGGGPAARRQYAATTPGSWVARTKAIAVALADTHKAWSSQSMQTLQRVGSVIRSTSLDCLAALNNKKGATMTAAAVDQQPQQEQRSGSGGGDGNNDGNNQQDEDLLVRASLGRFLTTASHGEVSQAARLADLSDMAYDIGLVTPDRVQQAHGLMLVAHSRNSLEPQQQQQQQQLLEESSSALPQATPWPAPMVLLQSAGSSSAELGCSLPSSPRTPFVLASYAEDDLLLGGAEYQPAIASGYLAEPNSPRRRSSSSSSAAAAAGGAVAVAPLGMPAAPAMGGGVPPQSAGGYLQPIPVRQPLAEQGLWYDTLYMQQQEDAQPSMDEAALLQQLKQQEALVLLEMQASQQMMLLLQQQQQQDTGSQQDLQQLQGLAAMASSTVTAAASTAAAAVLARSSSFEAAANLAAAAVASSSTSSDGASAAAAGAAGAVVAAPADWFCCDGPLSSADATPTRFFAIQGSITLEHWRINLTIDPCEFEAGALGPIKVHRGMYEAALSMYDTFLPLVQQHLAQHPDGKIAMTGHSLGGSLATLLMLLMVHRGDLPAANVATVYTFGSPAVFCEGANGAAPTHGACHACSLPCEHRKTGSSSSSATDSLLSKLGLAADAVVNVIMTRDIVPRAFVCDYTPVAGVLKSWLPSFKEHRGLAACKEHKALYNFVGVVEVLQPSKECDFVLPDEGHDMLPPGAALYKLTEPQQQQAQAQPVVRASSTQSSSSRQGSFNSLSSLANISSMSLSSALAELTNSFSIGGGSSSNKNADGAVQDSNSDSLGMVAVPVTAADVPTPAAAEESVQDCASATANTAVAALPLPVLPAVPRSVMATTTRKVVRRNSGSVGGAGGIKKSQEGLTLGDAILTFMNSPHPLQTLSEMRAYGHNGSISRYHNPASYTKALQQLDANN